MAKPEINEAIAALNREANFSGQEFVEHLRLHPVLTEQTKILDQARYAADEKSDYLAVFSSGERQFKNLVSVLSKSNKSCASLGTWPLSRHALSAVKEALVESRLVDNRVELKLNFSPRGKGEGWGFSFASSVPLQVISVLQEGLIACCALGGDGCSPVVDVEVRVASFKMASSDAFAFRQRASIYRAVRQCFLKALS